MFFTIMQQAWCEKSSNMDYQENSPVLNIFIIKKAAVMFLFNWKHLPQFSGT
jgi:hypothetical protein